MIVEYLRFLSENKFYIYYLYKVLEVKAKSWYSEKDEIDAIEEAKQKIKEYNDKLLKELEERFNFVDEENSELQFQMESIKINTD